MIEIVQLSGPAVLPPLDAVARLRIEVFHEFPYLYDGCESYEREYLADYAKCPQAVIVLASQDGRIIGASTGLPLDAADAAFREPFVRAGIATDRIFYFGESVLERQARGRGIGHRFFDERESHAARLGFRSAAFCSVIREDDHPLRPPGHRSHGAFWSKRGYTRRPDLVAELEWKQLDSDGEVTNQLEFWMRDF